MSTTPSGVSPPPTPPPDELVMDGKPTRFRPGESLIELAKREGVTIPYYCWHPHLSVAANCRMCLVEVEKAPKLVPACQTECRPGMVVSTQNAKVEAARRAVHEFLLVNHPIDCPICDQAGECKLQDYYMRYQATGSRMREIKVHKRKVVPLGPHVMYNAERCIVCTRCVRFMEEVAENRQLGVFARGDHSTIGTFSGQPLDDAYSLNTVDICPVGALTSRVFRFKQRVWNLKRTASLCGGCARGCNVHLDHRAGQVYRMLPRPNEQVNRVWLCDEGRLTYARANAERLTEPGRGPRATQGGGPFTAAAAARAAAALLAPHLEEGACEVVVSLHLTCEEAFVVGRLLRHSSVTRVHLAGYPDGAADRLLRLADKNPNRHGIARVLAAARLEAQPWQPAASPPGARLILGHEFAPALAAALAEGSCPKVHLGAVASELAERADILLPTISWVENDGTWANAEGRLQRLWPAFTPPAGSRPLLAWLAAMGEALGDEEAGGWAQAEEVRAQLAEAPGDLAQVPWRALPAEGWVWAAPEPVRRGA